MIAVTAGISRSGLLTAMSPCDAGSVPRPRTHQECAVDLFLLVRKFHIAPTSAGLFVDKVHAFGEIMIGKDKVGVGIVAVMFTRSIPLS